MSLQLHYAEKVGCS